jgi:hypothetical protein
MVEGRLVVVMGDDEGMMHAAVVVEHRVDRRLVLDQDQAGPGRIEKGHLAAPHGLQMPAADDLRIEPRALRDIADGNAEMSNALDRDHPVLPCEQAARHGFNRNSLPRQPKRRTLTSSEGKRGMPCEACEV